MIAGSAMRRASSPGGLTSAILAPRVTPPSSVAPDVPPALDDVVLKALANDPRERFPFASQMALALEAAVTPAPYAVVAELVRDLGRDEITERKALLEKAAALSSGSIPAAALSSPAVEPGRPALPVLDPRGAVTTPRIGTSRRRTIALVATGGLGVLVLAGVLVRAGAKPSGGAPAEATPTRVEAPTPSAADSPARSPLPVLASIPAPPVASASPPPRATHSRKGVRLWPGRTNKPDCTIPYVVDRNGIRVPRRECM
jgi:serine/threonine-protein kinase